MLGSTGVFAVDVSMLKGGKSADADQKPCDDLPVSTGCWLLDLIANWCRAMC